MKRVISCLLLCLLASLAAAQVTSNPLTFTVNNPIPTLTTLSPSSAIVGGSGMTLTLNGTNFVSATTATYNGVSHAFTFVSPTQGTIALTVADLTALGTYPVCTVNPAPGGGSSTCLNFQVASALSLTSLSPTSCVIYSTCATLTLTVNGQGFVSGSVINWNGTALTTTYVSATQLKATIPGVTVGGTYTVTVTNPAGTVAKAVGISWSASTTQEVTAYNVYRALGTGNIFDLISGTGISGLSMTDTSVTSGKQYTYYATSLIPDGSGGMLESDPSNSATVTVP